MRALLIVLLLTAGCAKSDPPKETAPAQSGKPTVRIAMSAAAASAMKPPPDASR